MIMQNTPLIEVMDDAQRTFYNHVADAGRKFDISHRSSLYLANLLADYSSLKHDPAAPGLHTRSTEAFALQIARTAEETVLNSAQKYMRMKAIGDTLLFSVGFIPESVMPTVRRDRPSLEYYVYKGSQAYSTAASARMVKTVHNPAIEMMYDLSEGFTRYAGTLFEVRKRMPGLPIRKQEVMDAMKELIAKIESEDPLTKEHDPFSDLSRLILSWDKKK